MLYIPPISFLVCSANEIIFMDTVNRANLYAFTATGTERIINSSKIVFNLNCTVRTSLLALHATDTTVRAYLTGDRTLIVIGALNDYLDGIINKLNNVIGTLADAHSASDTLLWVNLCNSVTDAYSISWTDLYAVSVSKTCKGAEFITVIGKVSGNTAFKTNVVILSFNRAAGTVTSNVCYFLNHVCRFNTER